MDALPGMEERLRRDVEKDASQRFSPEVPPELRSQDRTPGALDGSISFRSVHTVGVTVGPWEMPGGGRSFLTGKCMWG